MPRIMNRPGTLGFSSTFIFATVARPSYSVARASTVGASRRHGPFHSSQKSMSTTPFFTSLSKLLSVNVFTLSDAMLSVSIGRLAAAYCRAECALIYFDVLAGRTVPRKILGHPLQLYPPPGVPIAPRVQCASQRVGQRL